MARKTISPRTTLRTLALGLAVAILPISTTSFSAESEDSSLPQPELIQSQLPISIYEEVFRASKEEGIRHIQENYCKKDFESEWAYLEGIWIKLRSETGTKTNSEGEVELDSSRTEPSQILPLFFYSKEHKQNLSIYHTHLFHLSDRVGIISPSPEDYAKSYVGANLDGFVNGGVISQAIVSSFGITKFGPTDQFRRRYIIPEEFDLIKARSNVAYEETIELFRNSASRPISTTVANGDFYIRFEPTPEAVNRN